MRIAERLHRRANCADAARIEARRRELIHLLQVTFEDAVQVADTVKLLMGSDAQGRRGWLEEAAPDAEVDV